jgi:Asp-tRNA(Asn)/Glu-tRNA(Gln) amidotransferase A subunit family amidase
MIGTYALSAGYYDAYYLKAQKTRHLISNDFKEAFKKVDVIMGPVSPTTAFDLGSFKDLKKFFVDFNIYYAKFSIIIMGFEHASRFVVETGGQC